MGMSEQVAYNQSAMTEMSSRFHAAPGCLALFTTEKARKGEIWGEEEC